VDHHPPFSTVPHEDFSLEFSEDWAAAMWERLAGHLDRVWPDIDPAESL
jgi:hypothetical protein